MYKLNYCYFFYFLYNGMFYYKYVLYQHVMIYFKQVSMGNKNKSLGIHDVRFYHHKFDLSLSHV